MSQLHAKFIRTQLSRLSTEIRPESAPFWSRLAEWSPETRLCYTCWLLDGTDKKWKLSGTEPACCFFKKIVVADNFKRATSELRQNFESLHCLFTILPFYLFRYFSHLPRVFLAEQCSAWNRYVCPPKKLCQILIDCLKECFGGLISTRLKFLLVMGDESVQNVHFKYKPLFVYIAATEQILIYNPRNWYFFTRASRIFETDDGWIKEPA